MIDNYKDKLKSTLSEKRYKHSLGVCDEAVKLAEKYGADTEKSIHSRKSCMIVQRVNDIEEQIKHLSKVRCCA